jgi:hypothetical protein
VSVVGRGRRASTDPDWPNSLVGRNGARTICTHAERSQLPLPLPPSLFSSPRERERERERERCRQGARTDSRSLLPPSQSLSLPPSLPPSLPLFFSPSLPAPLSYDICFSLVSLPLSSARAVSLFSLSILSLSLPPSLPLQRRVTLYVPALVGGTMVTEPVAGHRPPLLVLT